MKRGHNSDNSIKIQIKEIALTKAALRSESISTRHAHVASSAVNIWLTVTLASVWFTDAAVGASWITITVYKVMLLNS